LYYISNKIVSKIVSKIQKESNQKLEYSLKSANMIGMFVFIVLIMLSVLVVFQVIGFDVALIM